MNDSEKYLAEILVDLKENHYATEVKADFEDEGVSSEDLIALKRISEFANLNLVVKIGGCGALKDIQEAAKIGARVIVAPMIESPYALKKYVNTVNQVFDKQEKNITKLYVNIETQNGLRNLDEIFDSEDAKNIDGVIFGRTDFTESMALNSYDADSKFVLTQAICVAKKAKAFGKDFVIGGGVSPMSVDFFNGLGNDLDKYETRKIVFDSQSLRTGRAEEGILKALKFEQLWIKNKTILTANDSRRIKVIESRMSCLK